MGTGDGCQFCGGLHSGMCPAVRPDLSASFVQMYGAPPLSGSPRFPMPIPSSPPDLLKNGKPMFAPCPKCNRHIIAEGSCPFCYADAKTKAGAPDELAALRTALAKAREKHPEGSDLIAIASELGELANAIRNESPERVAQEAIDLAVTALRFAMGERNS